MWDHKICCFYFEGELPLLNLPVLSTAVSLSLQLQFVAKQAALETFKPPVKCRRSLVRVFGLSIVSRALLGDGCVLLLRVANRSHWSPTAVAFNEKHERQKIIIHEKRKQKLALTLTCWVWTSSVTVRTWWFSDSVYGSVLVCFSLIQTSRAASGWFILVFCCINQRILSCKQKVENSF